MARIDTTSLESISNKLSTTVEGAKLITIIPAKSQYTCLKSEELKVW